MGIIKGEINNKILLIAGLIIAGQIIVFYAVSSTIVLDGFSRVEEQSIRHEVDHALATLSDDTAELDTTTHNWATWDETYAFIEDSNENYIRSYLYNEEFGLLKVDFMAFINSSGRVVFAKAFYLQNMTEIPLSQNVLEQTFQPFDAGKYLTGIVRLPGNLMVIASRPILKSDSSGPVRGRLVMGRFLDAEEIDRLSMMTRLSIMGIPFEDSKMPPDFQTARAELSETSPVFIRPLSENSIAGYAMLRDIYGEPVFLLRVDIPRAIYRQGNTSMHYFTASLILIGLVSGLAIGWLLKKLTRSQKATQESEERFRNLVESTSDFIWEVDENAIYRYVSPRIRDILGYESGEILGKTPFDLMPPEEAQRVAKIFGVIIARHEPVSSLENTNQHKDGRHVVLETSGVPFFDARGTFRGYRGIDRDITERKQAEEAIKVLARQWQTTFDAISDAIFLLDMNQKILRCNAAMAKFLGKPASEIIGRNCYELIHGTSLPIKECPFVFLRESRRRETIFMQMNNRWFEVTTDPLQDNGNLAGAVHIMSDITERKLAENELRLHSQIIANVEEGVTLVRASDGIIVYTNPKFERMFGYGTGELIGKHVSIINAPSDKTPEEVAEEIIKDLNRNGVWSGEVYNIRKDGTPLWCYANVSNFEHPDHGTVWISVLQDITERKRSEEMLRTIRERLKFLISATPAVIYASRSSGDYGAIFVSENVTELTGYEPEDFTGDPGFWANHIHSEDMLYVLSELELLSKQGHHTCEYRFLHKDGTYRWTYEEARLVYDAEGKPAEIVGYWIDITERKRMEEALKESEERYRTIIENSNDMIWTADLEGCFLFCNKRTEEISGYRLEDWRGKTFYPLIDEKELPYLTEVFGKILKGEPRQYEATIRSRDGRALILSINTAPLYSKGEMIGTVSFGRDITERKRMEEALRESEEKFRNLMENAPIGISITTPEGTIIDVNSTLLDIFGYGSKEEILKVPASVNYYDPKDRAQFIDLIKKGKVSDFEAQFKRKDGTVFWGSLTSITQTTAAGTIRIISTIYDITGRRHLQEALRQSEERFRAVFETARDSIFIKDSSLRYTSVNPAMEHLLGLPAAELAGMSDEDIFGKEAGEYIREMDSRVLKGETIEDEHTRPVKGITKTFHVIKVPMRDRSGRINAICGIARDVTERRQAEMKLAVLLEELKRSNTELEQFAYIASHDLQEPLRMVASYMQLIERRYKGKLDQDADDFITFAVDGAKRMQNMINDLLQYSRVTTRGKPFEPTDCKAILDNVLANLKVAIGESGAVIKQVSLPVIMADASQIERVFQNLIGNAIKFRGEKPPCIHIGVEKKDQEWVFSVKDNGIGFDMAQADRLFKMFQRLQSGAKYPGTGMGLAICKKIVERHGGKIWAESEPGKGATFYFMIPVKKGDVHETI